MTSHSHDHHKPASQEDSARMPERPTGPVPSADQLSDLCGSLAMSCYLAHSRRLEGFRREGIPREIIARLEAPSPGDRLAPPDRQALLTMVHDIMRSKGTENHVGLIDFVEFADSYASLSGKASKASSAETPSCVSAIVDVTNQFAERLVISLAMSQEMNERQSALASLSAIISFTEKVLPKLSKELFEARTGVLRVGAETPVWCYERPLR